MTPRIERLRKATRSAVPTISAERALLLTEAMHLEETGNASVPVKRAIAFEHILTKKALFIGEDELIVGERGPEPMACPTYPEVCLHSLEDLDTFHTREKVAFRVPEETRTAYREVVIPYWKGKSLREKMFAELGADWQAAFHAGIFTEFMEQRAPGHTVCGDRIYKRGMMDLMQAIDARLSRLDFATDPMALDKREQLLAMKRSAGALISYAKRHARKLEEMAGSEADPARKAELFEMARICRKVPANAPETFHEALQMYWFIHVAVITELNPWDAFNPGRLDQHLFPFYEQDLAAGRLTPKAAKELLMAFWVKFHNHPAPPKAGVTAKESGTYVDFALINLGGLTREGRDATNPLTYLILEVAGEMRLLQPSTMVQISKKSPDRLLLEALEIVRTGFGQPSLFNTDAIVQELANQGKRLPDAREGGASGCVEAGAFGREAYFLTGYFNLPKMLALALNRGVDPETGSQLGPVTKDPLAFDGFHDLMDAWNTQLAHFIDLKIRGNNLIERLFATRLPAPMLSLVIEDCIENATDYNAGGARYNTSYIQGVGLGSLTDSLSAIRHLVFETKQVEMAKLLRALAVNFAGEEPLRNRLLHGTPKYGNDDDRADRILAEIFDRFHSAVDGRPNTRGGVHRINLLPTTSHVYFGSRIGALPDGRKAGRPLSEGISPVQGMDRNGPTAALKSAAKIDHIRTGGTLLNQKFLPAFFEDAGALRKLTHLIRAYFSMDGHHIQFNVVDVKTLKKAQAAPDDHQDLIVRVAGYSDYFVNLTDELQEEVMLRTAHSGC